MPKPATNSTGQIIQPGFTSFDTSAGKDLSQFGASMKVAPATKPVANGSVTPTGMTSFDTSAGKDLSKIDYGAYGSAEGLTSALSKADPVAEARSAGYNQAMSDAPQIAQANRDTAAMTAQQSAPAWAGGRTSVADKVAAAPSTPATPGSTVKTDMGDLPSGVVPGSQGGTAATGNAADDQAARANASASAMSALNTGGLWEDRKDWTPEQNAELRSLYANGFKNEASARAQEIQAGIDEKKAAKDEYDQFSKDQAQNKDLEDVQTAAKNARWESDMAKAKTDLKNIETNSVYLAKALGAGQDLTAVAAISAGLDNANANFRALSAERTSETRTFAAQWERTNRTAWYNFRKTVGSEVADAIKDMDTAQANGYLDTISGVQDFSKQLALRLNRINGYQADFANVQNQQNQSAKAHLEFVTNSKKVDGEQSKLQGVYIDKNGNPMVDREGAPIYFRGDAISTNYDQETGTLTQFFADRTYERTTVGGATPGAADAFNEDAKRMAYMVENGYMDENQVPEKMKRAVSNARYELIKDGQPFAPASGTTATGGPMAVANLPELGGNEGLAMPAPKAPAGKVLSETGVVLPESSGPAATARANRTYALPNGYKEAGLQCGVFVNRALNLYGTGAQMGDTLASKEKACNLPASAQPSLNSAIVLDTGAPTGDGRDAGHVGLVVGQTQDSYVVKSSNWEGAEDVEGNPVGREQVSYVLVKKDDPTIRGFYDPTHTGAGKTQATYNDAMAGYYQQAANGKTLTKDDENAIRRGGYRGNAGTAQFNREVAAYRDNVLFPQAAKSVLNSNSSLKDAAKAFEGPAAGAFMEYVDKQFKDKYGDSPALKIAMSAKNSEGPVNMVAEALSSVDMTLEAIQNNADALAKSVSGPIAGWVAGKNPLDSNAMVAAGTSAGLTPLVAKGIFGEVGALTDADLKRYAGTIGGLKNTEETNRASTKLITALALRKAMSIVENSAAAKKDVSQYADKYLSWKKQYEDLKESMKVYTVKNEDGTTEEIGSRDQIQSRIHSLLAVDPATGTRKLDKDGNQLMVKDVVDGLLDMGIDPSDYSLWPGETDARERTKKTLSNMTPEQLEKYSKIISKK